MKEVWKAIDGFDGMYEVSNFGRVASYQQTGRGAGKRRASRRLLRPQTMTNGYLCVSLPRRDGTFRHATIHRLVAYAFHGAPSGEDATVNHKDRDKANNAASNLEWISHADNVRHSAPLVQRQRGEERPGHKLRESDVIEMRRRWSEDRESAASLGRRFGVSEVTAWMIVKRRKWRHI